MVVGAEGAQVVVIVHPGLGPGFLVQVAVTIIRKVKRGEPTVDLLHLEKETAEFVIDVDPDAAGPMGDAFPLCPAAAPTSNHKQADP
jgi:hypothetical protein